MKIFDRLLSVASALAFGALILTAAAYGAVTYFGPAMADDSTVINLAGYLQQAIVTVVMVIIGIASTALGTLATRLKAKTGIDIEKIIGDIDLKHNAVIQEFVKNQAGKWLAPLENVKWATIDVHNPEIAKLAREAIGAIDEALAHFGITPEMIETKIGGMIIGKIGQLTALSSPTAATSIMQNTAGKP